MEENKSDVFYEGITWSIFIYFEILVLEMQNAALFFNVVQYISTPMYIVLCN